MLREPTEYEAKTFLVSSGIKFEDRGHYFSIKCPFHKNGMEKQASAALYKKNWFFKCFTCGETMPFHALYKELKHEPWSEHSSVKLMDRDLYRQRLEKFSKKEKRNLDIVAGEVTSVYDNAKCLSYCRSRNLSDDFIKNFNLSATELCQFPDKKIWKDRLLIPIRYGGELYSIEGRDYLRTQFPKCLYPKGASVDVCFNQDELNIDDSLVVCEGIMDIPQIWKHLTKNVTATFGVSLSHSQKDFLKNCKNLILFIDDDEAGRKSIGLFESFMLHEFKVAISKGKDPGDSTIEELDCALTNAVPYGQFLVEDSGLFEKSKFSLL